MHTKRRCRYISRCHMGATDRVRQPMPDIEAMTKQLNDQLKRERVSRPAGFHHGPLAEPSVRLSPHSAPIRQTCRSYRAPMYEKIRVFPGKPFEKATRADL